jgi:hypothetical protein
MYLETSRLLILSLVIVALLLTRCEGGTNLPQAGPPPTKPLPRSMKGYELYSWRVGREWYFTLITATNRTKTHQEITLSENVVGKEWAKLTVQGVHDTEVALEKLPPDTHVVWTGPQTLRQRGIGSGDLALPPRRAIEDIKAHCQELGVRLEVSR